MDQANGEYKSGEPPKAPAVAAPTPLLTWPTTVQIALCLVVTASVFFLLGRWSQSQPIPVVTAERGAPVLDLNRATRTELRLLPGLGDTLAQRVVDHRHRHGRFRCVEDLRHVPGFGAKTLDRLRPWLFVTQEEYFTADDDSEPAIMPPLLPRAATTTSKKQMELTGAIDVNNTSQAELQKLPGIGPKLSQRILDERARAPFKTVEDLRRVAGIGPKTLEKLRPHVVIR